VYESRKKLVASKGRERDKEALGKEIAELPGGSGRMEEGDVRVMLDGRDKDYLAV